jgi:hypothetical protein
MSTPGNVEAGNPRDGENNSRRSGLSVAAAAVLSVTTPFNAYTAATNPNRGIQIASAAAAGIGGAGLMAAAAMIVRPTAPRAPDIELSERNQAARLNSPGVPSAAASVQPPATAVVRGGPSQGAALSR